MIRWRRGFMAHGEREFGFIEYDMSANNDFTINSVVAFIASMIRGIVKEHTWGGSRLKFVNSGGGEERITETSKNTEVVICRLFVIEVVKWGMNGQSLVRKDIKKIRGRLKSMVLEVGVLQLET
ncbi:hypothetical protein LIER_07315 [Lithospermum erythrorhizon]|uniref:Uncharacterized protein n=1 Tax=Lithospermum erythrorhizon TaxID=34254 RepID=A0AAV3P9J9_LITER